jgi:hypothetical protein
MQNTRSATMTLLIERTGLGLSTEAASEPYFCVGTPKLLLMSLSTAGVYDLYWFYRNWQTEQLVSGESLAPWARALFSPIFFYSFASRIKDRANLLNASAGLSPAALAILYVALSLSSRLPDPWWLLATISVLPVLPLQNALRRINAARNVTTGHAERFSAVNIVWLVFGVLLWLLVLGGLFLPALHPVAAGAIVSSRQVNALPSGPLGTTTQTRATASPIRREPSR